jgi:pimeloyl-ACP methyl ester carboxylesterase
MKQKIVILHGALGSTGQFVEFKEILSNHFEVYSFNFAGHGGEPIREPFSIDLFVANTLDFLNHSQLDTVSLFGYSMGGYVALTFALKFPERVNRVITLGTKFQWDPESAARDVRLMNPEVIEQKIPGFAETLRERHYPEDWKKNMSLTGEMMTRLGDGEALTLKDFSHIQQRVLICIGTADHMVSQEESAAVADVLPNGSLKTIEGLKHPIESVDKLMLGELCLDFLTD